MKTIQIPTVENTMGAQYNNCILVFKQEELSCYVVDSNTKAFSDKDYPKCAYIYPRGNDEKFRVLYSDLKKVMDSK
jgi:hypothetical protein